MVNHAGDGGDKGKNRVYSAVRRLISSLFLPILLLAGAIPKASGDDLTNEDPNDGWKLANETKQVAIYVRRRAGSPLKEFKAIGSIDAPTYAVHAVIDDFVNYPDFMPYTVECRLIKRERDAIVSYQRISPKICADRDYTLRVWNKSWPGTGGAVFLSRWAQANELGPPEKEGVVRVKVCDGSWLLEPDGAFKTRASYSVYTDSGGMIPSFIANRASQTGISRLFEAVRKRVKDPKYATADR